MASTDYDAIVVGSGPNGLSAAITLQQSGLSVLLIEAKDSVGGGMRSAELTMPHFIHDICSAVHPLAVTSPFFRALPLERYGLKFIHPDIAAAHPFDNGDAAALYNSLEQTAGALDSDKNAYLKLMEPLVDDWPLLRSDILGPFHFSRHPLPMARFGLRALTSAANTVTRFRSEKARGLWAGMAAHSMQRLTGATTSAIGLVLLALGHTTGWPIIGGGSNAIANALAAHFISLGGTIETDLYIVSTDQLPSAHAVLFDVTPRQLMQIAGTRLSPFYSWQLQRYRYGMGIFKIDWALDGPVPFTAPECRKAGTVHLGNTWDEIAASEALVSEGRHPDKPFVLLAQQSLFDPSRAPEGKHTAWAYCHVPNGSKADMTRLIEMQVERFAPGFRDRILERHTMNSEKMEAYNPNYVGGDISGGIMNIRQLFTRPALHFSPYNTSAKGIYLCSSSTPPGAGVHGMCGYYAARRALKEIFNRKAMDIA
jgi:phytoene dehydrogenase-like protein